MKILALNASYRGDRGFSRVLIDKLLKGAVASGAECEVITLSRLKINRCLACDKCQTKEHHLRCVQEEKDDVQMIFEKMAQSDLVVYSTPVYVMGMSVLLKTLFDRMYGVCDCKDLLVTRSGIFFHHTNRDICCKPFVAMVCCDSVEDETPRNVISYFKTYSKYMDTPLAGMLVRNAGRLAGHGADPEREKFLPKLSQVYEAYEQAGHELAEKGCISKATQKKANQEIMPFRMFHILKRLRPLKSKFVERARSVWG